MKFIVYGMIFPILGFLVIMGIFYQSAASADIQSSLNICRASVILAEKAKVSALGTDVMRPIKNMCKTFHLEIPEEDNFREYTSKEKGRMRNIADRVADCWREFGEGEIREDVFGQNKLWDSKNKCFVCFTFETDEKVNMTDLFEFMINTPYKAKSEEIIYCTEDREEDCVEKSAPECERKGGECREYGSPTERVYDDWSCRDDKECYVEKKKLMSYMDYIYLGDGRGSFLMSQDFEYLEPDEKYAITFSSDTTSGKIGEMLKWAAGGVAAGAVGVVLGTTPLGWAGAAVVGAAGGGALYSQIGDMMDYLNDNPQTVLLTKASTISNKCDVQQGVDER